MNSNQRTNEFSLTLRSCAISQIHAFLPISSNYSEDTEINMNVVLVFCIVDLNFVP